MADDAVIAVRNLGKTYQVPERESGLRHAVRSLVHRTTRDVHAVRDVSFEIAPGEIVGFLVANGAGKTTTLKMLAGLLHPTAGDATVLGFTPWDRDRNYLSRMALIIGQRNQLSWDIPVMDSYNLNRAIYRIGDADFRTRVDELVSLLDLGALVTKPARNLSLGERMKCEIAGSLLHQPRVLFLDEPTIGLDVAMQKRIRSFVAEYNARTGAAVMLTSHYMADVEALCKRVIVIHHGTLLYDGDLPGLVRQFSPHKTITIEFEDILDHPITDFLQTHLPNTDFLEEATVGATLRVPRDATAATASALLTHLPVADLTIEEPPIEDVIKQVFATGVESAP